MASTPTTAARNERLAVDRPLPVLDKASRRDQSSGTVVGGAPRRPCRPSVPSGLSFRGIRP